MTVFVPRRIRSAARLLRSAHARRNAAHEWRRRIGGEPPLPSPVRRVLVLCHGNICRSPYARVLLARLRPELEVVSAGLAAGRDAGADPTARQVAARRGVDLAAHRSRPLDGLDLAAFDLVLVMEAAQAAAVVAHTPAAAARVRVLGDYLPAPPFGIDDPWGQPEPVFEETFARIALAVERLAKRLDGEAA